jgi:histidinol-phosphate aminotransferase
MTPRAPARPAPRIPGSAAYRRPPVPAGLLKLDANEGLRPDEGILDALRSGGAELLRRYPDVSALEAALAARLGVPPEHVIATAGADDAIDRSCRAYLEPGRTLVEQDPGFHMFSRAAGLQSATVVRVPWRRGPFPCDAFLAAIDRHTGVVAVISPGNPVGAAMGREDLERIARAAPGALVVLDHAYVEYADEDLTPAARRFPNVVVLRTLSKAWGLAGCRVGYAVGDPEVIGALRAAGQPYPVAAPSAALALAQLARGEADMTAHVAQVRSERHRLVAALRALGGSQEDSQANFLLVECGARRRFVKDGLGTLGIAVRDFPDQPGLEGALRVTLPGREPDFERLRGALATCLAPEAVLVDERVCAPHAFRVLEGRVPVRALPAGDVAASVAERRRSDGSRLWMVCASTGDARAAAAAGILPVQLADGELRPDMRPAASPDPGVEPPA